MVTFHPEARFLTDFAAGSLPASQALCVSSHLHYCAACRAKVRELNELGSALFSQQHPAHVSQGEFDRLMGRIECLPPRRNPPEQTAGNAVSLLPHAIDKLTRGNLQNLKWRNVGRKFRISTLNLRDNQYETSLFFIKAGGSSPRHTHKGDEITVVLQGSFSDHEGKYGVGDFVVRTQGEIHRPVASQDQDCLCLSTLDAPIVMQNWLLRLLMKVMELTQRKATLASR